MGFRSKIIGWVDKDISTSFFQLRPLSLVVGILPMVVIGFPASFLANPAKIALFLIAAGLCFAWIVFWGWRAYLWLVSPDYQEMLRRERVKLPTWRRRNDEPKP